MERLYKRLVTVGMITITSILAWIYCIMEYRKEAIYVIVASLVVVSSLYVLLLTYISLKCDKEAKLRSYISETIAKNLLNMQKNGNEEDVLRLLKAMYIQLRKRNEADTNEKVTASINKAMKIIVKYNQSNNDAMLASIQNLQTELATIKSKLNTMHITTANTQASVTEDELTTSEAQAFDTTDTNLDMFQTNTGEDSLPDLDVSIVDPEVSGADVTNDIPASEDEQLEATNEALAESFFEAFGTALPEQNEDAVADVIPFPNGTADVGLG